MTIIFMCRHVMQMRAMLMLWKKLRAIIAMATDFWNKSTVEAKSNQKK